jgi:uncharacterized Zn-finger protein
MAKFLFDVEKRNRLEQKGILKRHIKIVHDKIKEVKCEFCSQLFSLPTTLKMHIKSVHEKIRDLACPECDFKCSQIGGGLNKHIKAVHRQIKDKQCPFCDYKSSESNYLKIHIKSIHESIKDLECTECGFKCSRKASLREHSNRCTGKSFMSSMELKMKVALVTLGVDYSYDSTHNNLKGWNGHVRFDFIISWNNTFKMIEMNGMHHYSPVCFGGTSIEKAQENFARQLAHDAIKAKYCVDNGYLLLIVKYDDKRDYLEILKEFLK